MSLQVLFGSWIWLTYACVVFCRYDEWNDVPCNQEHQPENCDLDSLALITVDDYDRCGPARLPLDARNYYLAAAGRRITYKENKDAFDRIRILPKMLRDVSKSSVETTILGLKVAFPVGLSPTGFQILANRDGELATVAGVRDMGTIMILSNYATTSIEAVAEKAKGHNVHLWMQIYMFVDRRTTLDVVERAEKSGFKGVVVTSDSPVHATVTCGARNLTLSGIKAANIEMNSVESSAFTFDDISWLKKKTNMPIILKGLLSGEDAQRAVLAGASAILVSNHGGRQEDGAQASIDALPVIVEAVNKLGKGTEVYIDGGIRSGHDVYKAIARGAKMAFVGRPVLWGLAIQGAEGVKNMMSLFRKEFNETMLMAGSSKVSDIRRETVFPPY